MKFPRVPILITIASSWPGNTSSSCSTSYVVWKFEEPCGQHPVALFTYNNDYLGNHVLACTHPMALAVLISTEMREQFDSENAWNVCGQEHHLVTLH